jgi:hypothetical protein
VAPRSNESANGGSGKVLRRLGGEEDLGRPKEKDEAADDAASRNAEYCRVVSDEMFVTELS